MAAATKLVRADTTYFILYLNLNFVVYVYLKKRINDFIS